MTVGVCFTWKMKRMREEVHMCERKRRMEQFAEVLLSNAYLMNTSGSCFFSRSMLIKRGKKEGEGGNLSLLNRELDSVLYPDRLN